MTNDNSESSTHYCPHCNAVLKRWQTPEDSTWGGAIRYVCFNDECPYFVEGWEFMEQRQAVTASYRHMLDPESGSVGPLPVWSAEALKDGILD